MAENVEQKEDDNAIIDLHDDINDVHIDVHANANDEDIDDDDDDDDKNDSDEYDHDEPKPTPTPTNRLTCEERAERAKHHLFAQKATEWLTVREFDTTSRCLSTLRREGYDIWVTDLGQEAVRLAHHDLRCALGGKRDGIDDDDDVGNNRAKKDTNITNDDNHTNDDDVDIDDDIEDDEDDDEKEDDLEMLLPKRLAVVFGTEAVGCSTEMLRSADLRVYFPLRGFADSLNLSVATALVVHHLFVLFPSLVGSMTSTERQELRARWFAQLAVPRLLTARQKRHRARLRAKVQQLERLEIRHQAEQRQQRHRKQQQKQQQKQQEDEQHQQQQPQKQQDSSIPDKQDEQSHSNAVAAAADAAATRTTPDSPNSEGGGAGDEDDDDIDDDDDDEKNIDDPSRSSLSSRRKSDVPPPSSSPPPLNAVQLAKMESLRAARDQLLAMERAVQRKAALVVSGLVDYPPDPLTDMRRPDEHRVCFVGKGVKGRYLLRPPHRARNDDDDNDANDSEKKEGRHVHNQDGSEDDRRIHASVTKKAPSSYSYSSTTTTKATTERKKKKKTTTMTTTKNVIGGNDDAWEKEVEEEEFKHGKDRRADADAATNQNSSGSGGGSARYGNDNAWADMPATANYPTQRNATASFFRDRIPKDYEEEEDEEEGTS